MSDGTQGFSSSGFLGGGVPLFSIFIGGIPILPPRSAILLISIATDDVDNG